MLKKKRGGGRSRREGEGEGEKKNRNNAVPDILCYKSFPPPPRPSLPPLLSSVIISIAPSRDPNAN